MYKERLTVTEVHEDDVSVYVNLVLALAVLPSFVGPHTPEEWYKQAFNLVFDACFRFEDRAYTTRTSVVFLVALILVRLVMRTVLDGRVGTAFAVDWPGAGGSWR